MTPGLYESMRKHSDIAPIMDLLDLVDPCDEFSQALCLVRDCFAENNTLRTLSRNSVQRLLSERTALMTAYETSVMQAAADSGTPGKTFQEAALSLPVDTFVALRKAYRLQVDALMGRPLRET